MKEVLFNLNTDYIRPVIRIYGLDALVDTGARFPVTSLSKDALVKRFNAKCIVEVAEFKGFGGSCVGSIFELEIFKVGDLTFPNLKIFQTDEDVGFPFILSVGMFDEMDIQLSLTRKNILFQIQDDQIVRNQHIKDSDGNMWVLNTD